MDMDTATKKRVYIRLPEKYMASLAEKYDLDHGLFLQELNPDVTEEKIKAYFREWGNVTTCCKVSYNTRENKTIAFVAFSSANEADRADSAGPHYIGGSVEVKRVVSPKLEENEKAMVTARPRPRRFLGLGYMLEDSEWLDEEMND